MQSENPEEVMTFGELLALIGEQQRRLKVLESAFTSLACSLDEQTALQLTGSLRREAQNQQHDETLQQHFSQLAEALEKKGA